MDPLERNLIIGFTVAIVALVAGIVVAIVLTRDESQPVPSATTVTPTTTNIPIHTTNVFLQNGSGECYSFTQFRPQMGTPGTCTTGFWIVNSTQDIISFDGNTYEYCIQVPTAVSEDVNGSTSTRCRGIQLINDTIKVKDQDLCINDVAGDIEWNVCATALKFVVKPVEE